MTAAKRSACVDDGDGDVGSTVGGTMLMTWTARLWKKIYEDGDEVEEETMNLVIVQTMK
jgi:hypothetical protein